MHIFFTSVCHSLLFVFALSLSEGRDLQTFVLQMLRWHHLANSESEGNGFQRLTISPPKRSIVYQGEPSL